MNDIQKAIDNLPSDAFQPKADIIRYDEIQEWWCPDCGANEKDYPDFIEDWRNGWDGINNCKRVTYCCGECFEENIFILINKT